ncbi:MAG: cytochrome b N-terminal domain-containing protein [Comamonadaceae bacterium]|nr:cytochrome b N-terminal domain-containing protein [Comamonadaceae bacterium]
MDNRFPADVRPYKEHMSEYYAPKNFNFWYFFGSLAMLVLVIQIVTGIFLVMHYKPDARYAFASVEYIMRDVPWRLAHPLHALHRRHRPSSSSSTCTCSAACSTAATASRASWSGSSAALIFLCLMAEAFIGYLLPWGQMSYWGAQVIVNLFAAIPFDRPRPVAADPRRLRGRRRDAEPLLRLPRDRRAAGAARAWWWRTSWRCTTCGSNNPDGVEIKDKKDAKTGMPLDGIPFHPYYTVHDIIGRGGVPDRLHRGACSSRPRWAATSSSTTTSSRPTR